MLARMNLLFHSFLSYCKCVISVYLYFFLFSTEVHFGSALKRKDKPQVSCLSLCLLSKVCGVTVTK